MSWQQKISELSGEELVYFAHTSGTSGELKPFPFTKSFIDQFQMLNGPFIHHLTKTFKSFGKKPLIYFAGSESSDYSPQGIPLGFISNYNYRNLPGLIKKFYALPNEVFVDGKTFGKYAPLYALATDLSGMIAIVPSVLIQFARSINEDYEGLLERLEKGDLPPGLPKIKLSSQRKAYLRTLVRKKDRTLKDIFPTLTFCGCWTASSCAPLIPELQAMAGDVRVIDVIYSATEGWISMPLDFDLPGGVVHVGAILVEFLPVDAEPVASSLRKPWELELGQSYEVVLTNKMGMVRYRLGDVVRCLRSFHRAPVIEFVQKNSNTVSLGICRVGEAQIVEALSKSGLRLHGDWCFAPGKRGNHLTLYYTQEDKTPEASQG